MRLELFSLITPKGIDVTLSVTLSRPQHVLVLTELQHNRCFFSKQDGAMIVPAGDTFIFERRSNSASLLVLFYPSELPELTSLQTGSTGRPHRGSAWLTGRQIYCSSITFCQPPVALAPEPRWGWDHFRIVAHFVTLLCQK